MDQAPPNRLPTISGSPPSLLRLPPGCHFASRCPHRFDACDIEPELKLIDPAAGHPDRCHLSLEKKRSLRVVNGAIGLPSLTEEVTA